MRDILNPTKRKPFWQDPSALRQRFSSAVRTQAWHWYVLNLAWTAGPVTYIALHGGYYLGYGKSAAPEAFIYFAGYTVIAGLLAVINQLVQHMVITPRQEQEDATLRDSINQLFLVYFAARNEYLKSYDRDEQQIIAAWWSLRNASTDVGGVEEAIRDITNNDTLALAYKRIELYRRQGFADLMTKERNTHYALMEQHAEKIAPRFPGLAELLRQRFSGSPPDSRSGQKRQFGFIERLRSAEEHNRIELTTLDDALSIILLTLELLLGRVILTLHPEFKKFKQLEESKERFDALLSDFRLTLRKRNGRMRALITDLALVSEHQAIQTNGATSEQLVALLSQAIKEQTPPIKGHRRYQEILTLNERLRKLWQQLHTHEQRYNKLWNKHADSLKSAGTEHVAIEETELQLSPRQRVQVAEAVTQLLEHVTIRKRGLVGTVKEHDRTTMLELDDFKLIGIELVDILDDMLNITEPEEQLAIEASKEADFGCIEPELAAVTKCNWGSIMVDQVQQDRTSIAHEFAASLVRYMNMPLSNALIQQLTQAYGASEEYLTNLQTDEDTPPILATEPLREHVLALPKFQQISSS